MRTVTVVLWLSLAVSAPAAAQRWAGVIAAGYGTGLGDSFSGQDAVGAVASGFRGIGAGVGVGLEAGYSRFATLSARVEDLYGPGTFQREDVRRELWHLALAVRLRPGAGAWRPYVGTGAGAYLVRVRDVIEARDASGSPLPQYRFDDTQSALKPGLTAFAGLDRARLFGRTGLGVQLRWHGVADAGLAHAVTVGVGVSFD
jgi:hypothetical protein